MSEEPEFKKGQKSYLSRFVNLFQNDAKIALQDFKEEAKSHISDLEKYKKKLEIEISNLSTRINSLNEIRKNLEMDLENTKEFHSSIFEGDENGVIISNEITGFVDDFNKYKSEIEDLKSDIDKYKEELFGKEDEEGTEIPGLNHKIESLKAQLQNTIKESQAKLNEFVKENGAKQEELFSKIEGLLKGASNVALAKAFNEHKNSFIKTNIVWMVTFIVSVLLMMGISIWGFIRAEYEFKDMWKYTLGNLPFIAGSVWLAIYSSKQRSQNKRLQQEYAYKEDIAKVYYGLKEELKELEESEKQLELKEKMLTLVIDVIGLNPSDTLDSNSHNEKGPIMESIKDLLNTNKFKS